MLNSSIWTLRLSRTSIASLKKFQSEQQSSTSSRRVDGLAKFQKDLTANSVSTTLATTFSPICCLPLVEKAPMARIVMTASAAHYGVDQIPCPVITSPKSYDRLLQHQLVQELVVLERVDDDWTAVPVETACLFEERGQLFI
ncbi:hypothetical protein BGZ47_000901 [Haplosporangium gracile]|nr:hypothetical protein BGZ47_000901 [Haplosporangium gracile]